MRIQIVQRRLMSMSRNIYKKSEKCKMITIQKLLDRNSFYLLVAFAIGDSVTYGFSEKK